MEDVEVLDTLILAAERGMNILALLPVNQFRTPVAESFRDYCDFVTSQCDALAIAERFRSELDAARAHLDQIRPSDFRLTYELQTGEEREFGKATATETLLEASKHSRRLALFVNADDPQELKRFDGADFDQWQLERCVNAATAEVRHVRHELQSRPPNVDSPHQVVPTASTQDTTQSRRKVPAEPAVEPEGDATTFGLPGLERCQPSEVRAWSAWNYAVKKAGKFRNMQVTYKWLKENFDPNSEDIPSYLHDYVLPSIETWNRQVRAVKKSTQTQTNQSRTGRTHGKSIVRDAEI